MSWKPGSLFGIAPMSPPPCTLFWPRSGLRPEPQRPTWPHSSARLISESTLSTPTWCSVMPSVQQIIARSARAKACAVSRIISAGTPVMRSPSASVYGSTCAAYSAKPDGRAIDEAVVDEAGVDDLARHRVRERDVGADVEPEPAVGPLGRGRAPRIDRVEPRAVVHALEQVVEEDRMRLTGIRSPQEDDVRLLDLAVGRGPAARTERCRQTDDTGSVSGAVT